MNIQIEKPLDLGETKRFWQNILQQEELPNDNATWIKGQKQVARDLLQMEWDDMTVDKLQVQCDQSCELEVTWLW